MKGEEATTWAALEPDAVMVTALDKAGQHQGGGDTNAKRNWGKRFADACAVGFASALRGSLKVPGIEIRPYDDGTGTESLTGVAGGSRKKVDVIASTLASGLQVAVSMKAENFPDQDGAFGKNLLNRIYELQDEVRAIHEYQPRAYVVGVFYLPLAATVDRGEKSTFARAVGILRGRTGRTDLSSPGQLNLLDSCIIGLYAPIDVPTTSLSASSIIRRGVCRYFDVAEDPPINGRPTIDRTLSLTQLAERIARDFDRDAAKTMDYSEPEVD